MTTEEAITEAARFTAEHDPARFDTQTLIAAAILWGENVGLRRAREIASAAMREASEKIRAELLT